MAAWADACGGTVCGGTVCMRPICRTRIVTAHVMMRSRLPDCLPACLPAATAPPDGAQVEVHEDDVLLCDVREVSPDVQKRPAWEDACRQQQQQQAPRRLYYHGTHARHAWSARAARTRFTTCLGRPSRRTHGSSWLQSRRPAAAACPLTCGRLACCAWP